MAKAKFKLRGEVLIEKNGVLILHLKNLVVDGGLNLALQCIFGTQVKVTHIGLGSSATAPTPTQTALVSPLGDRRPFDAAPGITDNVVTAIATFPAGEATGSVSEAGLFSAITAGTMFSRVTFPAVPKGVGDELKITWVITASNAT